MRKFTLYSFIITLAVLISPFELSAQKTDSSIGMYSPYTFYGVGSLGYTAGTASDGMGGASVAFRSFKRSNLVNPAAFSAVGQRSFLFEMGLAGLNMYSKQRIGGQDRTTSNNMFNLGNVSVLLPITKGLGLGINVLPYSSVGYYTTRYEDSDDVIADIGAVQYVYSGEGGITQFKIGAGWEPFKGFSVGAEMIYLRGNIDRTYNMNIIPYTGSGTYNGVSASQNDKVSRILGNFGVQYGFNIGSKNRLTLGAAYRLGGQLNADVTDYIPSGNIYGDTVRMDSYISDVRLPAVISAGLYYQRPTFGIGFDYQYQNWADGNSYDAVNKVGYVNTSSYRLGAEYTPDRGSVRSFFKRVTYRAGVRYGDYYLSFDGHRLSERSVSIGFEIPFMMNTVSNVNVAFELGKRGNASTLNRGLVLERFFRVNVGITLFGGDYDYWFVKYKYD